MLAIFVSVNDGLRCLFLLSGANIGVIWLTPFDTDFFARWFC